MRRFPMIQLHEGRCVAPAGKQNGAREAPRTPKKRKKLPLTALNGTSARELSNWASPHGTLLNGIVLLDSSHELSTRTLGTGFSTKLKTKRERRSLPRSSERDLSTRNFQRDSTRLSQRDPHTRLNSTPKKEREPEQRKDLLFIPSPPPPPHPA